MPVDGARGVGQHWHFCLGCVLCMTDELMIVQLGLLPEMLGHLIQKSISTSGTLCHNQAAFETKVSVALKYIARVLSLLHRWLTSAPWTPCSMTGTAQLYQYLEQLIS